MLSVLTRSIMLNVIMLSVVAPPLHLPGMKRYSLISISGGLRRCRGQRGGQDLRVHGEVHSHAPNTRGLDPTEQDLFERGIFPRKSTEKRCVL